MDWVSIAELSNHQQPKETASSQATHSNIGHVGRWWPRWPHLPIWERGNTGYYRTPQAQTWVSCYLARRTDMSWVLHIGYPQFCTLTGLQKYLENVFICLLYESFMLQRPCLYNYLLNDRIFSYLTEPLKPGRDVTDQKTTFTPQPFPPDVANARIKIIQLRSSVQVVLNIENQANCYHFTTSQLTSNYKDDR